MTHAWTYETAVSFWSRNRRDPAGVWDTYVSAECFLLEHKPRTPGEAAQILAILIDQGGDRRSDSRDVEALARMRRYLLQLSRFEAAPAGSELEVRAVA